MTNTTSGTSGNVGWVSSGIAAHHPGSNEALTPGNGFRQLRRVSAHLLSCANCFMHHHGLEAITECLELCCHDPERDGGGGHDEDALSGGRSEDDRDRPEVDRPRIGIVKIVLNILSNLMDVLEGREACEQIRRFHRAFLTYIKSFEVFDLREPNDRIFLFAIFAQYDNLRASFHDDGSGDSTIEEDVAFFRPFGEADSVGNLRLETILKFLRSGTLQHRITGLSETRDRINEAVEGLDRARHQHHRARQMHQHNKGGGTSAMASCTVVGSGTNSNGGGQLRTGGIGPRQKNQTESITSILAGNSNPTPPGGYCAENRWATVGPASFGSDLQSTTPSTGGQRLDHRIHEVCDSEMKICNVLEEEENVGTTIPSTATVRPPPANGEGNDNGPTNVVTATCPPATLHANSPVGSENSVDALSHKADPDVGSDDAQMSDLDAVVDGTGRDRSDSASDYVRRSPNGDDSVGGGSRGGGMAVDVDADSVDGGGGTTPMASLDPDSGASSAQLRRAECEMNAVLDWILDSQLLELLMSPEYLHPELLKRCARIPLFMVDQDALADSHLSAIWRAAVTSSHESIKHAVFNLLLEILDKLGNSQIRVLYQKLRNLPATEHDSQSLLLVNKFADAAMGLTVPGAHTPLGYDLLWMLAQESTPIRNELHETAVNNLLQAVNRLFLDHSWAVRTRRDMSEDKVLKIIDEGRLWLLEMAVKGVRSRKSCIPCQFVITTVLRMWPVDNNNKEAPMGVCADDHDGIIVRDIPPGFSSSSGLPTKVNLIRKYDLIDLIVEDLCWYSQTARGYVLQHDLPDDQVDTSICVGEFYIHAVSITTRLDNLKYALSLCLQSMQQEQHQLGGAFTNAMMPNEQVDDDGTKLYPMAVDDEGLNISVVDNAGARTSSSVQIAIIPDDNSEYIIDGVALTTPSSSPNHQRHHQQPLPEKMDFEIMLGLTFVHIDMIWTHLVENGSSYGETDQCLQAFHYTICQTGYYKEKIRAHLVPFFFQLCQTRMPVTDIRQAAFALFGLVMSFVNIYQRRLEPTICSPWLGATDSGIPTSSLKVIHFDILGLDKMWDIVLCADCEEVASQAMSFLSTIYGFQNVSSWIREGVPDQQQKFIDRCIAHLLQVVVKKKEEGIEADIDCISAKRCLKLLSCFAENIMTSAKKLGILQGAAQSHGSLGLGAALTVKIQYLGKPRFEVKCMTTDTVGMLRKLVKEKVLADHDQGHARGGAVIGPRSSTTTAGTVHTDSNGQGHPPTVLSNYRLIFSGRELTHEQARLSSMGISNDFHTIYCCPRVLQNTFNDGSSSSSSQQQSTGANGKTATGTVMTSREHENYDNNNSSSVSLANEVKNLPLITEEDQNQRKKQHSLDKLSDIKQLDEKMTMSEGGLLPNTTTASSQQQDQGIDPFLHHTLAPIAHLIKPRNMECFFSLLNTGGTCTRDLVWSLLMLLPTDKKLRKELQTLSTTCTARASSVPSSATASAVSSVAEEAYDVLSDSPSPSSCDWEALLPKSKNVFRLLYCLQLVDAKVTEAAKCQSLEGEGDGELTKCQRVNPSLVEHLQHVTESSPKPVAPTGRGRGIAENLQQLPHPDTRREGSVVAVQSSSSTQSDVDTVSIRNDWCGLFLSRGGFSHIVAILLGMHAEGDDSASLFVMRCIHRLQKLISFFLEEYILSQLQQQQQQQQQHGILEEDFNRKLSSLVHHTLITLHSSVMLQNIFVNKDHPATVSSSHDSYLPSKHLDLTGTPPTIDACDSLVSSGSSSPLHKKKPDNLAECENVTKQCLTLLNSILSSSKNPTAISWLFDNWAKSDDNNSSLLSANIDKNSNLCKALLSSLVWCPNEEIRTITFSSALKIFISNQFDKKYTFALLSLLLTFIQHVTESSQTNQQQHINGSLISQSEKLFLLLESLIMHLWDTSDDQEKEPKARAVFFSSLDDSSDSVPIISNISHFGRLLSWIAFKLMTHGPYEQQRNESDIDFFLVGLISLVDKLCQLLSNTTKSSLSALLQHVFNQCLFDLPVAEHAASINPPKCKTSKSRQAAFHLIVTLCSRCPENIELVIELILAQQKVDKPRTDLSDWNWNPLAKDKNACGYVGLGNLGATCYMNSLLQQFFMIPPLRFGLLAADSTKVEEAGKLPTEENLLYQLQLLFGNLLLSEKKYFDTRGLCNAYKDFDGQPLNPGEQQDVDEFFSIFMDKLETSLKPMKEKNLLKDIFGGEICNQIICQECKHQSERCEDCLVLSLDVKGKKSVLESLDLYVEGEMLDGENKYFCENCSGKRDSLKRACISTLPNTLILHLKRFEFDLEIMRKVKVNDCCEFPMELDMSLYTKEFIEARHEDVTKKQALGYYQFNLKGVLVHTGTADSGHYYSFIKERHKGEEWYCFNDGSVTPFDPSTMPSTCFGGTKVSHKFDPLSQKMIPNETPKQYSAYLLIYERNYVEFQDNSNIKNSRPLSTLHDEQAKEIWHPPYEKILAPSGYVPKEIFDELVRENTQFLMDKFIFAPEYSAWLLNVATIVTDTFHPPPLDMIKSLTYFVLEVLVRSKEKSLLESFMKILCNWYGTSVQACRWLLDTLLLHSEWSVSILLKCPIQALRQGFVSILTVVFSKLAPLETELYSVEVEDVKATVVEINELDNCSEEIMPVMATELKGSNTTSRSKYMCQDHANDIILWKTSGSIDSAKFESTREGRVRWWKSKSILAQYVGFLMSLLVNCEVNWKRFDQLFEAIYAFACCGYAESIYCIQCGMILRLLDIFLGDSGNIPATALIGTKVLERSSRGRRFLMGDKFSSPNFSPLMALLDILVRSTIVYNKSECEANFLYAPGLSSDAMMEAKLNGRWRVMPKQDAEYLSANKALQMLMEQGLSVAGSVKGIISHLCFNNLTISKRVCMTCQKSIEDNKSEEFSLFLDVLLNLVYIIDRFQSNRVHLVMSTIMAGIKANIRYEKGKIRVL